MAMSPERKAERKAQRDYDKRMASLTPCADAVKIDDTQVSLILGTVKIVGHREAMKDFNEALEKMGFRPVRITRNMLNDKSPEWCIDANTPAYMDPGCESYHSM